MTRALFDLNVLLDVLLDRSPHAEAASAAWALVESGRLAGFVPAHGVTTIHYIARRHRDPSFGHAVTRGLLEVFDVAMVDRAVLKRALDLDWTDFEDAVCAASAERARCDVIVSRDPGGFRGSGVRIVTPEALVASLRSP